MKSWFLVLLGLFFVALGIVILLIAVPTGLIVWTYMTTPTNTTTTLQGTLIDTTTTSHSTLTETTTTLPSTLMINPLKGEECAVDEYCNIPVAEATGGQKPYSYQSDSFAAGAPPMGMAVDLNGHLKGTPSRAGEYRFGVCVADATRTSKCTQTSVTVTEKIEEYSTKIDSFTCAFKYKDTYGDKHYELKASGSATGPKRAELQIVFNPGYYTKRNSGCTECNTYCGVWGTSQLQSCARGNGPDTTVWEVYVPASQVISGNTLEAAGYRVELYARIFIGTNLMTETIAYATCPK